MSEEVTVKPAILFLDIETFPDVAYVWGVYEQDAIEIVDHWYVLSFAAQWRGQQAITVRALCDFAGSRAARERQLLKEVHTLLSDADIVVAHNGADFDVRKLNARFIAHGMPPPSPFKVVDTKRDLASVAKYSSNRLNWLCKQLGIGRKTMQHQDFELWKGCAANDTKAWREMKRYNRHDVELLRELYELVAPWIEQPNAAVWNSGLVCSNPACASRNIEKRGWARAKTRVYQRYQCRDCGSWSRAVKSEGSTVVTPVGKRFS